MLDGCTPGPRMSRDVPRSRLLARHHAERNDGGGDPPRAGEDRAGLRRLRIELPGPRRDRRPPRVRLRRRGNRAARPRRRPASEHSGIRLHVLRAGADRRHSGHRAARAPAHRGRAFPARVGRRRVRHPRRRSRASTTGRWRRSSRRTRRRCARCSSPASRRRGQHSLSTLLATPADAERTLRRCAPTRPRSRRCCCRAARRRCRS